jgi:hypothetical protein
MNIDFSINGIWTTLSLLGLVYLIFWRAGVLASDWFRDKMFELRDDLFDEATDGLMDFDNPAYGVLRTTMNGYIRYCHKLSLLHMLMLAFFVSKSVDGNGIFSQKWKDVTRNLDPKVFKKIEEYRKQMELLVITYLILASPIVSIILLFVALIVFIFTSLKVSGKKFFTQMAEIVSGSSRVQPFLRNIDDSAYSSGAL